MLKTVLEIKAFLICDVNEPVRYLPILTIASDEGGMCMAMI